MEHEAALGEVIAELASMLPRKALAGAAVARRSAGDWCHFAVRLACSVEHRRLKGGQLAYEDEKFSSVAMTRVPERWPASRIVRRPVRGRPGRGRVLRHGTRSAREAAGA